jgi:hypothetical protein
VQTLTAICVKVKYRLVICIFQFVISPQQNNLIVFSYRNKWRNKMKNADKPANPVITRKQVNNVSADTCEHQGLTKREELASRNLAAILSSLPHWESLGYQISADSEYARQAIDAADALLAELEK